MNSQAPMTFFPINNFNPQYFSQNIHPPNNFNPQNNFTTPKSS